MSGLSGTISNVTVSLNNLTHPVTSELDFLLVSPSGGRLVILSDSGNAGITSGTIVLSDAAASLAPATGGPLGSGTFRPTNNGANDNFLINQAIWAGASEPAPAGTATLASVFNGTNPNGNWQLYIFDDASLPANGVGALAGGWSITITTQVTTAPTATVLTSSANPAFAGDNVTFTATVTSSGSPVTTGTVTFLEGATTLAGPIALNGSGQASFSTTSLVEGAHVLTARYNGATGFGASTGTLTQVIDNRTVISGAQFCNPGTIRDLAGLGGGSDPANPYPQRIFVSGLGGTVSKVTVRLNSINHQAPDDLDILLVAPSGQRMIVMSDAGGFQGSGNSTITLDDAAASEIPNNSLSTGTFRPTNHAPAGGGESFPAPAPAGPYAEPEPVGSATLFSTFGGIAPNGTWSLYVVDDSATFTGTIGGYCLTFITSADPATTTTVTSSLNPSLTGNNVTFTATVQLGGAPVTTGTVTFREGATILAGPIALNGAGQASFSTTSLTEGSHTITAQFNGAPGFAASNGNIVQTVDNPTVISGTTFCNNGGLTIPTSGPASVYPQRIFVSGLTGTISKVTLTINNFSHASPDDVELLLVGPTGAAYVPWSDVGGFSGVAGVNFILDDDAASPLPDNSAFFSGTFRPTSVQSTPSIFPTPAPAGPFPHAAPAGTATFATQFRGTNPLGPWSIYLVDDTLGNGGSIGGVCLNFTLASDLTVSKTHTGNFTQGETGATYTITINNISSAPTSGVVTVTDTLPAGLTATAISGSGWNCTLATLTCTRSDALAANSSYPAITLTVNVASNAPASVTNQASVSGGGEINTTNNSASDATTVVPPAADLTIAKTHAGNFSQGQTGATYTITVSNTSGGPTTGTVTVVDTLPTGLTATAMTGAGWTCVLGTLTCTRSDVLAGNSAYPAITLTVNVAADAPASVTNQASVSGGGDTNAGNNNASDVTTITAVPADLTIAKTHAGNFSQGQTGATYTISVSNAGTGPTTGTVTVVDTLPTGLTATAMTGAGWTCVVGTLTCTRSDVLAGNSAYPAITLTVNVAADAPASVTNQASVSGGGDTNAGNNNASDVTTITAVPADLTIAKTHAGNFSQGQTGATYTITVSNAGTGPTTGTVTVVDTLPTGLTATAISGAGWTCILGTLTCTRSDVLAGNSAYPAITLTVNVAADAPASVTNQASVSGAGDTNAGNNNASDVTTIAAVPADLTIAKTHAGNFSQGQTGATYTITVSNAGTGPTTGTVTVVDTLPAGLTATALTGAGWTCVIGTLTCTRSDVIAGSSAYPAITLTVSVAANAPASVTNQASVSGGGDTNAGNNNASDVTTITAVPADLTIAKTHAGNFAQGQTGASYMILVSNAGTGPTTGAVTVVDTLPAGLTATAISGAGWTCILGTLSCTRSDVLAGNTAYPAITLTVNVAANAPASVTNQASVTGGGDTNAGNNNAADPTTIIAVPTAIDVSSSVRIATTGFVFSRVTQTYNGTLTLTNMTGTVIAGPVNIVLANLTPNVTLVGPTGTIPAGPYITLPGVTSLAAGQSINVPVRFQNPSNVRIDFNPVTFSGSLQ